MTRMVLSGRCRPPAAWLALVMGEPRLAMLKHKPQTIDLTPAQTTQLHDVQDAVNAGARYEREAKDVWGRWKWRRIFTLAGRWKWIRVGDCDDFAAEKLRRLLGMGFGGSLRLVMCKIGLTGHLVLAVDTLETTLVLDNRHNGVWPWDDARFDLYTWVASSVPGRKMWARIKAVLTLEDLMRRNEG